MRRVAGVLQQATGGHGVGVAQRGARRTAGTGGNFIAPGQVSDGIEIDSGCTVYLCRIVLIFILIPNITSHE